ncbi:malonyl-ACP O-methyltransferase BioC [Campylobacter jejuni]|uniref:malonyl-ACP O-methyltransferase BioC n=1 Tax=Campylobacter jejuni TaxID=197 RepID=UPI000B4066DE|nr:malonyl-ACP O-methyltransferase BioC [Campylobacter jejuni]EAB5238129.1 malonyl-[acyl-carrier protein] O-methyltransferase BioC [Campylobacter jejuni]EAB5264208.1 malonyl-[acyl-carrier protein] O-methyltransferase BioC [Campylobacter jejuni]EAB5317983.1 malonyl-[acyl-carrier protein] O-methyltransferase BioC [Campylobacter jejuni]EAH4525473.1 malonyl-[acyl-carrier protein] O-methyltransferase BioC [Campylobacter jejuni]EAH4896015.1 malonyl-[acyl-carrier protein] O-methyltransferase BioC [Ca
MNFLKAKDYEKHAKVQDFMGLKLCEILKDLKISHFEKVFEFGCGRGELSKKLQNFITFDEYVKNDILDFKENSSILIFDMNEIAKQDLSKEKFDLIVSNATLQWLDLKRIIPSLRDMLNQNGILLLSTFAEQNLKEIKQSTGFGLNYFSLNELEQIFKVYFNEVKITQELIKLSFDNALDVFRHLKLSGVNSLGFYPLNKGFLKEFEEKFQNKLTYHPVFILCKNDIK